MNARRLTLATLCVAILTVVFSNAPALALTGHAFSTSFGGSGANALSDPQGVAIDQSTGEVYVVDSAHSRVEVFSASGAFISSFGGAGEGNGQFELPPTQITVDNSGPLPGDVYVLDGTEERVEVFNAKGEYLSQVTKADLAAANNEQAEPIIRSIAVDGQGNLWIYSQYDEAFKFPGGRPTGSLIYKESEVLEAGLAIDPSGDFYSHQGRFFEEFDPSGNHLKTVGNEEFNACGCATGLGLDPVSGDLYADRSTSVAHFLASSAGFASDSFGSSGPGALVHGTGVAVMGSTGSVYVADAGLNRVDIFNPATLADVTAEAPTALTRTKALLHGTVNPSGVEVSSCEFEWGSEPGVFTHTAACSVAPGSGNAPVAVSAEAGVSAGATYHYRLVATNANGTNATPQEQSFTTPPAVDALSTGTVEDVTAHGAKLTGALSPDGVDTHYYFEYGTSTAYGSVSPALPGTDAGSATESVQAETTLSGLAPSTVYHYRLVGVNSFGVSDGEDQRFLTPGPPTITSESAEVRPDEKAGQTGATLQAQVNPEGAETTYRFEYGETQSYGGSVPVPDGSIGSEEQPVSVPAAELTGLKVGTAYHYRVVASNEYGTVDGPDQVFRTLPVTLLDGVFATEVASTSATLGARINPLGSDTSAYFQYGPVSCTSSPASCTSVPLVPGTDLGSGESDRAMSAHLQNLTPGATYHYRVVATNALGSIESEDKAFTTQAAVSRSELPDGRAWEMVSSPDKQGAPLDPAVEGTVQASLDGSAITYLATGPTEESPQGNRALEYMQLLGRRGPDGWVSKDIEPAQGGVGGVSIGAGPEYRFFSSDLSLALLERHGGTETSLSAEAAEPTPYLRDNAACETSELTCYEPLGTKTNVRAAENPKLGEDYFKVESVSADLSHVVVGSVQALTSTRLRNGLYEWAAGKFQIVSVLPAGEGDGVSSGSLGFNIRHAVSADGTRVVWVSTRGQDANGTGHLYTRDMASGESVRVDPVESGAQGGQGVAQFQSASSDGLRVFFTDTARLTVDSIAQENAPDLYEYDLRAGKLMDLTVDRNLGEHANVQGAVLATSEDGSDVYFVANGVLAQGAAPGDCTTANQAPTNATCNLYVSVDGQVRFIATLSDEDGVWGSSFDGNLAEVDARVSPEGRWFAFRSVRSLTGYDNRDALTGGLDSEVFLYDASSNRLVCASCNPTGARPTGASVLPEWERVTLSGAGYQPRYLSDNGRLFFDSSDALLPRDTNGVQDVYEFEPEGVGSCGRGVASFVGVAGGCLGLISSGGSAEASTFLDASEGGNDVFFLTASGFVPQDYDGALDVYDARVCTSSSPCLPVAPVASPPCDTSDSCKAAPSPQPAVFGEPSSQTFSGAGNVSVTPGRVVEPKSLTVAQKLAKALQACRKKRSKQKRSTCERQARRRYAKSTRVKKRTRVKQGSVVKASLSGQTGR